MGLQILRLSMSPTGNFAASMKKAIFSVSIQMSRIDQKKSYRSYELDSAGDMRSRNSIRARSGTEI